MLRLSWLFLGTAFLLACGTSSGGGGGGSGAGLDENGCPIDKPSEGASCDSDQKVCEYWELVSNPDNIDCDEKTDAFRCEGGEWALYPWECHCPEAVPEAGSDCLGYHATITGCAYPATGDCGASANCGDYTDYVWEVILDPTCPDP